MPNLSQFCRTVTTFSATGELDEEAFRQHLNRLVGAKIGVYLASGGSGESYAMTQPELRRVYEIGVEECRGKVPVYANPPEQHTARGVLMHSLQAIEAGCEAVNIYPIAGWHGMRPRDAELRAYYDTVLKAFKHPTVLAINPVTGYIPPAKLVAEVISKYHQVIAVNLTFVGNETYLVDLKDMVVFLEDWSVRKALDQHALSIAAEAGLEPLVPWYLKDFAFLQLLASPSSGVDAGALVVSSRAESQLLSGFARTRYRLRTASDAPLGNWRQALGWWMLREGGGPVRADSIELWVQP